MKDTIQKIVVEQWGDEETIYMVAPNGYRADIPRILYDFFMLRHPDTPVERVERRQEEEA